MDTSTVYSTFDWDQLAKNSRQHARSARENALKLVKKVSLNVICWKLPKIWLHKKSPNFTVLCIFGGVSQFVKQQQLPQFSKKKKKKKM